MKFFLHPDLKKFKRSTAVILPKDIGPIVSILALSKDHEVVEIGGGSGFLSFYLARIVKKLYIYEKREDFYKNLIHNLKNFNNVEIKNEDGRNAKENAYAYIIDSSEFMDILPNILEKSNWIVLYLPQIVQARDAALFLSKHSYKTWIVRSYLEEWDFDEKILKPKNKQLAHTAFLVFGNKI